MRIPELVRSEPACDLEARYRVVGVSPPGWNRAWLMEALQSAHVVVSAEEDDGWLLGLHGRTLVYGIIRRDVDETVALSIRPAREGVELALRCRPTATHNAHAAGMAGALAFGVAVWLTGGWVDGIPAALTTLVAGFLWSATAREMALQALQRRLRRLAEDLGTALWPGRPATLLPPPPRMVPR